jgi:hypothetical protein
MDGIQWFGLPIGTTAASLCLAMLVNAAIWVFWFGQVLERRFRNPSTTILSKRQSYCITLCFELTLLGFLIPVTVEGSSYADWWDFTYAAELLLLNVVYCALLVMALLPNRQLMQDWARYRHRNLYHSTGRQWRSSTWFDLLWHEKSPALIAIGVNMAIAAGLLMIWLLSAVSRYQRYFTFSLLLTLGSLLLCAAIAQYTMSLRTPKRNMWTAVGVAIAILTPIITAIMVSSNLESVNTPIWLFTIIPWIAIEHMSGMIAIGVFLTQLSLFGLIHSALSYRLHKFGESEMKVLLSATHS